MATEPDLSSTRIFLAGACSQSLLTPEDATVLSKEAESRGIPASQLVVEKGLMDAVQVDIVETLLRPEQTIPNYEVLSLIGRGGMGIVYRARQKNLDRIVAIKTVLISLLSRSGAVARFEKEALSVAKFRHPNIVTAYDFGRHAGRLFFVMELLEGETLERMIDRLGPVDEALAWNIVRQTAGGLAHAAEANIVHRDIKPANLILVEAPTGFATANGTPMVKITDFGLALLAGDREQTSRLTSAGTTLGTPTYMAPEQISSSEVDCRADIYSLGATAFHMLTGQPPFGDKKVWEIMAEKSKGTAPRLDLLKGFASSGSVALIRDMMAHDPLKRVGDYQELIARIDRLSRAVPDIATVRDSRYERKGGPLQVIKERSIGRLSRSTILGSAAVVIVVVSGVFAALKFWPGVASKDPAGPRLVSTGNFENLFNGKSLAGWFPLEGVWTPAKDAEGGLILSGRGGIRRPLPAFSKFRLTFGLDLHQADAAEIHFGLERPNADFADSQPRYVLRVSRTGIFLGRAEADRGTATKFSPVIPYTPERDADAAPLYKEVRIERQQDVWLAFYDGKRVGSVALSVHRELSEFRLWTESGPAFFDGATVEELVEPEG
jgi:serine/threonine protein kinase